MIADVSAFVVTGSILVAVAAGIAGIGVLGRGAIAATDRLFAPAIPLLLLGSLLFVAGVWTTGADDPRAIVTKTAISWTTITVGMVILQFLRHSTSFPGVDRWTPGTDGYDVVA
ncbi:hypothetical protein DK926_07000 [Rhodococcus sp. Eu-32]|uniref:hypothetical protein n=1 Tax=Rhodococcus sp. Eu-32 TaxID=1017319 RepID=UPI000DF1C815|nr:hypothetical protein [Rhodococcus sp. Eu-32]RRQ28588.1 hypothetical protein DK926_07000 [Rhodococcus sp. Eu-32]